MRRAIKLPKTDLAALERDILSKGGKAGLPRNLSDMWLLRLGRDLLYSRAVSEEQFFIDPLARTAGPLLIVKMMIIERRRAQLQSTLLDVEELTVALATFEEAVIEEIACRQTGIFFEESALDVFLAQPWKASI